MLQDKKTTSIKIQSHAVAQSPGPTAISQPFVPQSLQFKNIEATPTAARPAITPFVPSNLPTQAKSESKDAILPFQLIQKKKQKRVKPAIQKKTENIVQKKQDSNKIIQRKVLIEGNPMEKDLKIEDVTLNELLAKKSEWLTDQYKRNYLSLNEFKAHANGDPVQCGLIPTLALWYRLPLPSAITSIPPKFFLLGELHNISPLRLIVEESNQQSAKVISENGASFANAPLVQPNGTHQLLPENAERPNTHMAELGLAKTLYAFTSQYSPLKKGENQVRLDPDVTTHAIAPNRPEVSKADKVHPYDEDVKVWDERAQSAGPIYRHIDGRPYFIEDKGGKKIAYIRNNVSPASKYKHASATSSFLDKKEIIEALQPNTSVLEDFTKIRKKELKESEYESAYNRVFNALRESSDDNLKKVYPGITVVTRSNPNKKPATTESKAQLSDIETAMDHRNTAMVGALEHASKGGYAMASFGAQHVTDIKAWYSMKGKKAPFDIITFDDLVRQQYAL